MLTTVNYHGEIAAKLAEFQRKGQQEASKHRPPTDATAMDQNEVALRSEAERWLVDEQRLFDVVMTEGRRTTVEVQQNAIELQTKIDQLVSDNSLFGAIEADLAGERNNLVAVTEKRLRAVVDWKAFCAQNNITGQAIYPESHIWHFAVVLAFALVETVINAFFYENTQGLLGGFTVALGIAVINMAGAMSLGAGFRYKNLSATEWQALGWSCLIVFIAFAVYCNALFAAFRAEYQLLADPTDVRELRRAFTISTGEAKRVFYLDMQLSDLMSFILFGVGTLLSIFAFYKGYTFDDRFPGHGSKDRLMRRAQQQELELQDCLRLKVRDFLHHRRGEVQGAAHEPAQLINRASSRIADLQHAQSLLNSQGQAIQRDFGLVLGAYRAANASVRANGPPTYFQTIPQLLERISGAPALSLIQELVSTQEQLKLLRERNQEPINTRLRRLQEDSAEILGRVLTEFFVKIETEAKGRIDRLVPAIHRAPA
jgi:hypothetical protein